MRPPTPQSTSPESQLSQQTTCRYTVWFERVVDLDTYVTKLGPRGLIVPPGKTLPDQSLTSRFCLAAKQAVSPIRDTLSTEEWDDLTTYPLGPEPMKLHRLLKWDYLFQSECRTILSPQGFDLAPLRSGGGEAAWAEMRKFDPLEISVIPFLYSAKVDPTQDDWRFSHLLLVSKDIPTERLAIIHDSYRKIDAGLQVLWGRGARRPKHAEKLLTQHRTFLSDCSEGKELRAGRGNRQL